MSNADDPAPVRVLRGLDAVRLRPTMYVGDPADGSGLHRMIELAVLDALARRPTLVAVALRADGSVEVADDGAPFPSPALELLTHLMRYDPGHLPLVNALSSRFVLRLRRDDREDRLCFADGRPVARLAGFANDQASDASSATVTFLAAGAVFGTVAYDRALVARRLRDLGRGEPGALLQLT